MGRPKAYNETEIMDRALELFWKKGFHASSMDELLKHMGISRATFYNLFKEGKEELYRKTLNHYQHSQGQKSREWVKGISSTREKIRSFFRAVVEEGKLDPDRKGCFIVNSTSELANQNDEILDFLIDNEKKMILFFEEFIKEGQENGEIPAHYAPEILGAYLFSSLQGLRQMTKINPDPDRLNQVVDLILANLE